MSYSRIVLAGVAGVVAFYIHGFIVFGKLIANDYNPYLAVYRTSDTVIHYMPIGFLCTLIGTVVLALIYAKGYEGGRGIVEGLRFGLLIGLFVAMVCVGENYVTLNIGGKLALEQAVGTLTGWTVVGVVIGLIYKPTVPSAGSSTSR